MSLGRKLSLDAGAAIGTDDGRVACSRRQDETVAWFHRESSPAREHEIDRAANAVQELSVRVLVLGVGVARRVRPAVYLTSLTLHRSLDRLGIGRGRSGV